jgi:hypothetical protein
MKTAPIDIKPMKKRGIWGIARKLYFRSFAQFFLYGLLVIGIASGLMMYLDYSSMSSMSDITINGQKIFSIDEYMTNTTKHTATTGSLPILPPNGDNQENDNNYGYGDYNYGDVAGVVSGAMGTLGRGMLVWVLGLLLNWVLTPMFRGGMSTEVRRQFGGMRANVREMIGGGGRALSTYFGTQACINLVMIGVAIVMSILCTIVVLIALVPLIISLFAGSSIEGVIGWLIALVLLLLVVFYIVFSLFAFTYDVVANEDKRYFKAIGRSFRLVWKKLGRVIVVQLVPQIVFMLIMAAVAVGIIALADWKLIIPITVAVTAAGALFFAPYQALVCSVLYYDVRVRLEGGDWTDLITNAFRPSEPETAPYEPQEAPFEPETVYDETPDRDNTEE